MANACNNFLVELAALVDYFRAEYDLTYAEAIGCLDIIKHRLLVECENPDDEEDEDGEETPTPPAAQPSAARPA